ncbi:MAG: hypothetical protein U0W24_25620 [Bacteroidales bacterium]
MKHLKLLEILVCTALLTACGPTVEEAIKYNDEIITKSEDLKNKMITLKDSHDNFNGDQTEKAYSDAMAAVKDGLDLLNKMEPFDKDSTLRNAAIGYFKICEAVLSNEHRRLIDLMKLPDEKYGDAEVAEYASLRDESDKKVNLEMAKLLKVQQEFAKKHNFKLEE